VAENKDELEYRKKIEEERAKMAAQSGEQPKKPVAKYDNKVKKVQPAPMPKVEASVEPVGTKPEDDKKTAAKAEKDPEKAAAQAEKAAFKDEKKTAADAKKAEEKEKKEFISGYDSKVKDFIKTRANRDIYWTDNDWNKREFWDRKNIEKRQKKLYKKQIQYMWKNSAYMRVRMEGEGVLKTGMVKNLADIAKLPFISNADLARSQREAPPCGYICSTKPEEMVGIGVNGEVSAVPRYFFTSSKDVAASYRYARPLLAAGVTKDDIVVLLGQDDFWGVSPLCEVLKQDFGCMVICVSYLDAKRRMEVISQLKATVLVGTPSQAKNLADAAGIFGMDAAQTSVRIVITGGEPGVGSSPEIGKSIEEAWNAKSYEFYGCQDVGILAWSCDAKEGLHLMETPLLNKTVPVTRYRTRDIVSVVGEPCSCHRMMTRIVIKYKLADEPVAVEQEPPPEEVIEPEPEPVAVAAGISEVEAEAAAEDIGSEVDGGHEEPAPEEPAEPEAPAEPETPAEPAEPVEPEKPAEE